MSVCIRISSRNVHRIVRFFACRIAHFVPIYCFEDERLDAVRMLNDFMSLVANISQFSMRSISNVHQCTIYCECRFTMQKMQRYFTSNVIVVVRIDRQ